MSVQIGLEHDVYQESQETDNFLLGFVSNELVGEVHSQLDSLQSNSGFGPLGGSAGDWSPDGMVSQLRELEESVVLNKGAVMSYFKEKTGIHFPTIVCRPRVEIKKYGPDDLDMGIINEMMHLAKHHGNGHVSVTKSELVAMKNGRIPYSELNIMVDSDNHNLVGFYFIQDKPGYFGRLERNYILRNGVLDHSQQYGHLIGTAIDAKNIWQEGHQMKPEDIVTLPDITVPTHLVIHKDYRGKELASRAVEDMIKDTENSTILVGVAPDNIAPCKLFSKYNSFNQVSKYTKLPFGKQFDIYLLKK